MVSMPAANRMQAWKMTAYVLNDHLSGAPMRMPEHTNNSGHSSSVKVR